MTSESDHWSNRTNPRGDKPVSLLLAYQSAYNDDVFPQGDALNMTRALLSGAPTSFVPVERVHIKAQPRCRAASVSLGANMMSNSDPLHPYSYDVVASKRESGGYHWAIRKHGKLVQRSDSALATEAKARTQALAMIDRLRIGQVNW